MTSLGQTSILLLITAVVAAPGASAIESWCVEGACANYENEAWGEGDCEESADHYAYRGYSVTYEDETSVTGAYVYQYCWTYDDGEIQGEGNAMSIAVSRLDWTQFSQDGAFVWWESSTWGDESYCTTMVITHVPGGLPNLFEPIGCPVGDAPPMLLPALP